MASKREAQSYRSILDGEFREGAPVSDGETQALVSNQCIRNRSFMCSIWQSLAEERLVEVVGSFRIMDPTLEHCMLFEARNT